MTNLYKAPPRCKNAGRCFLMGGYRAKSFWLPNGGFGGRGLLFTLDSGLIAGLLSAAINPLAGRLLEQGYWFYRYHYTITPVLLMIPIFVLLGYGIPAIMYRHAAKQSVVERLREAET